MTGGRYRAMMKSRPTPSAKTLAAQSGATYPIRYKYDRLMRMKELATIRDGTTWDTTRWLHDPATGLATNKVYADTSSVSYAHTPDGKLLRTTWAREEWREHTYTPEGLPSATTYSDATPAVSLVYDAFQQLAAATNTVAAYAYANSALGIATNETATIGGKVHTLTRGLDDRHRLAGLAISPLPLGKGRGEGTAPYSVAYTYDNENRLATVSNDIFVAEYAYTPDGYDAGYTVRLTGGAVLTRSLVRDTYRRGLIKAITNLVNGLPAISLTYDYDVLCRPTRRNADTFGYNIRSEVTSATIASNAAIYAYDNIGNHTTSAVNSVATTYSANVLNQYTTISNLVQSWNPVHDLDGNMVVNGFWTYSYDVENRLVAAYSNSVCIVSNAYDHSSRRVQKFTPSATHAFIYDGWNLIQETIQNQQSTITNHFVWGRDLSGTLQGAGGVGGLLAIQLDDTWYFPFFDNNGNITAYVDESGTVVASYTYDAFGATLAQTGVLADAFAHRFSTKYHDPEIGLYYYGYRFYDPVLHRWLNRDPIEEGGGVHLYGFCANSPISFYDYMGEYVNLVYEVEKKTLTANDVDTGTSLKLEKKVYSGNGKSCGKKSDQWKENEGPLPTGKYLVGLSYVPPLYVGQPGDYRWYKLYGANGKGGYTYDKLPVTTPDGRIVYRGGFNLHTGRTSDGCVTVWSDVAQGEKGYPHSSDFDKIHQMLNKTKPLQYKKTTFSGWLEVK